MHCNEYGFHRWSSACQLFIGLHRSFVQAGNFFLMSKANFADDCATMKTVRLLLIAGFAEPVSARLSDADRLDSLK
jgi:hypothetical protein